MVPLLWKRLIERRSNLPSYFAITSGLLLLNTYDSNLARHTLLLKDDTPSYAKMKAKCDFGGDFYTIDL